MPRVLVTGGGGQVGRELALRDGLAGLQVIAEPRTGLDVTDTASVRRALDRHRPDAVINSAAYTAVDRAETEQDAAFAVNEGGAAILARECARRGIALIHLSTDYVFDGSGSRPYLESDPPNPVGVYGRSKLAGERAVADLLERHVVMRTSWVYAAHGANFVRTMLRLAGERDVLQVVDDQHGAPTWAGDVATATLCVAGRILDQGFADWGTFHYTARGRTSWHGLAQTIVERAATVTGRRPRVDPVPTSAWPTAAHRPANSSLDCSRIDRLVGPERPQWTASLSRVLDGLLEQGSVEGDSLR